MPTPTNNQRQGIQSIEIGLRILDIIANAGRPLMLRDIAKGAALPSANVHRYLVSFIRTGVVVQDQTSGRYDLGPHCLDLGLAGLARLEPIRLSSPILENLCEEINESVALAVWGSHGPTIVRIVDAGSPVTITLRPGTVLSLTNSATGRAFAAFHRSPQLKQSLDAEINKQFEKNKTGAQAFRRRLATQLEEIRKQGISRASGSLTPGINGFSVPVLNYSRQMVAAITSLGAIGEFNVEWESKTAKLMKQSAAMLSKSLGYIPDSTLNLRVGEPEQH